MSFKEVKELRNAGELERAHELAQQDLAANPEDIWCKRSIAWVYYDYLKKYASHQTYGEFVGFIRKLKELALPSEENMVFDKCAYQVGKMVYDLARVDPVDYTKINELFDLIEGFKFTRPSEPFSFLHKAFLRVNKNWLNYLAFAEWWGLKNFRSEDYLYEELNGKRIISLAEQAYNAYAKKLLEGEYVIAGEVIGDKVINKEKILSFIPELDTLIASYPDFQYPPYYKAKLLLAVGDQQNIFSALLPFAKKKKNDFWVWEIMGDSFSDDEDKKFACYCRALSCKSPEEMLVNIRQKMAAMFIQRKLFNEAKTEITLLVKTRTDKGYRIPPAVNEWMNQNWYNEALEAESNSDFYKNYFEAADEILFYDIPEVLVFVEFVNSDKKILNFIASEEKWGFVKYDRFFKNIKVGDVLKVRFQSGTNDGPYKVYSMSKTENEEFRKKFFHEVEGVLRIREGRSFGFLNDIYVHQKTISKNQWKDGSLVKGYAIKTYNAEKKQWGWKLV